MHLPLIAAASESIGFELHFPLQSDDASNPDRLYDLVGVVVHCGSGPNRGHYISIVRSQGLWLLFDDDIVEVKRFPPSFLFWCVCDPCRFLSENRSCEYRRLFRSCGRREQVLGVWLHPLLSGQGCHMSVAWHPLDLLNKRRLPCVASRAIARNDRDRFCQKPAKNKATFFFFRVIRQRPPCPAS